MKPKPIDVIPDAYQGFTTTATGAGYRDPKPAGLREFPRDTFKKVVKYDRDFITSGNSNHKKEKMIASYEYLPEMSSRNKKVYRTEDKQVITAPANFLTMKPKTGRVQRRDPVEFGGVTRYTEDDYNIKSELLKKEIYNHYAKIK